MYRGPCFAVASFSKKIDCFLAYLHGLDSHARNTHPQTARPFALERQYQACPTQPDFFSILKYDDSAKF
jgi:hypothetical protein